jgi:hypothetical protein
LQHSVWHLYQAFIKLETGPVLWRTRKDLKPICTRGLGSIAFALLRRQSLSFIIARFTYILIYPMIIYLVIAGDLYNLGGLWSILFCPERLFGRATPCLHGRRRKTFTVHRALPIMPALTVAIFIAMLVAGPLLTTHTLWQYFTDPQTYRYARNLVFLTTDTLPGVVKAVGAEAQSGPLFAQKRNHLSAGELRHPIKI